MLRVYLGDLSHQAQKFVTFPYAVALVASYALKELGSQVEIELFKDFDHFRDRFREARPHVVGLTNYMWNSQLSTQTLNCIKKESPEVVTVLGGANYDDEASLQAKFLARNPGADFHIYKEGERAFASLLQVLIDFELDVERLKRARVEIPSVHYLNDDGDLIRGPLAERLKNLDEIPSPYLSGLMDRYFEEDVSVLMQRTRGCPFVCTFCTEGTAYYNKVARFSTQRLAEEFQYCAERLVGSSGRRNLLHIADANFGMFPEDLEVAGLIADIRKEYSWPGKIEVPTGKNKRERVLDVVRRINDEGDPVIRLTASVQSTDPKVLENIKRSNISVSDLIAGAKDRSKDDRTYPYGEVILCLSGDTAEAHKQTARDLINDGISKISHQYLTILPGTEMNTPASRERFGTQTAFRIMPGAYGRYTWGEEGEQWFETEERAIASDTMTLEDYLECLEFDLTVESFYNDNLFDEFTGLLSYLYIPLSRFIDEVHSRRESFPPELDRIYKNFVAGRRAELARSVEELLEKGRTNPRLIEELRDHENKISLGVCKAAMVFGAMEHMHPIAHAAMRRCLEKAGKSDAQTLRYFEEASRNSCLRKSSLLDGDSVTVQSHFDFVALKEMNFCADPLEFFHPEALEIHHEPNAAIRSKYDYLLSTEPDQLLRWRKLLFEPRCDSNDEFCRIMRRAASIEEAARRSSPPESGRSQTEEPLSRTRQTTA